VFTKATCILEKIAMLIFENGQCMLTPRPDVVEKVTSSVKTVAGDDIERTRITTNNRRAVAISSSPG
jgi:hypothetical protein